MLLGSIGREFESHRPDHNNEGLTDGGSLVGQRRGCMCDPLVFFFLGVAQFGRVLGSDPRGSEVQILSPRPFPRRRLRPRPPDTPVSGLIRALSSAGEHHLDMVRVGGSIPPGRTIIHRRRQYAQQASGEGIRIIIRR